MVSVDTDFHFFGKVAASYTHEIKNVLATINEAGGLMQDILALGPEERNAYLDKLPRSLAIVEEQVERGQYLTKQFNAFSHAADHDPAQFNLNETLPMMAALLQRLANRSRIRLEVQPGHEDKLTTKPVPFLKLLFTAVFWAVAQSDKDTTITLETAESSDSVIICLQLQKAPDQEPRDQESWAVMEHLAESLGFQLGWDESQGMLQITAPGA